MNDEIEKFINTNIKIYDEEPVFLANPTSRTTNLWNYCKKLIDDEIYQQHYPIDCTTPGGILSHSPGYIDQNNEIIVGLQGNLPLQRIIKPLGGLGIVNTALSEKNLKLNQDVNTIYTKYAKTHNDGVFDVYTDQMKLLRKTGLLSGLPDNYSRGRIIGDYRRIAYYGVDYLIDQKETDKKNITPSIDNIQLIENISEQIKALIELKQMAETYNYNIAMPAKNTKEAIQWMYFGYLACVKVHDGAAMSFGRIDSFIDVYAENDLRSKTYSEENIQEFIDDFIIKLRMVRHLRPFAYDEIFAGNPTWITMTLGGLNQITKTTYRILNTLRNLGSYPEPNLTIMWNPKLSTNFKNYCSKLSIETSSVQYINDAHLVSTFGKNSAISCCVSGLTIGKDVQYFGARCNLPKLLLYTINGGHDELTNQFVLDLPKLIKTDILDYQEISNNLEFALKKLIDIYIDTMNIIHYMHDKYAYEKLMMALHDSNPRYLMGFGVAGLSVITNSLSAIKYAKVKPIYKNNIVVDFIIDGEFPKYGNNDDKVDSIAIHVLERFNYYLNQKPLYHSAIPTLSVLTITSNVMYGKKTGNTPDGRRKGEPFAPGANPTNGTDSSGLISSLESVAKIPYHVCIDGISNTLSICPSTIGTNEEESINNLRQIIDGYISIDGYHLNVNIYDRNILIDAMSNPEKYQNLTIRVSGYAVKFVNLSKEHQLDVISRTYHGIL